MLLVVSCLIAGDGVTVTPAGMEVLVQGDI